MPQTNPLALIEVTQQQRRLIGDMEARNDAFFDKNVYTSIARYENPMSPAFFFGSVIGNTGGGAEDMFEPMSRGIGAEFIKIMEESEFVSPAKVVDASKVPDTLIAGENVVVTMDKGIADADETLQLMDQKTMIRVESRRLSHYGVEYTIQLKGLRGQTAPGSLLRVGKFVNQGFGNNKGQGSTNSNTLPGDLMKRSTFTNLMSIMRYGYTETGSYMSDEVYKLAMTSAMDGTMTELALDLPVKFMKQAVRSFDGAIVYDVPNFDPLTKTIINQSADGRNAERPSYAGIYWQLDQCPYKYYHNRRAPISEGVAKIDRILGFLKNQLGTAQIVFAMCQGIGYEWLEQTLREGGLEKYGIKVQQIVNGGDKLKIGFEADQYFTNKGTIIIYDMSKAVNLQGRFDMDSYNGITYAKRSADIFLIPMGVRTNGKDGGKMKKPAYIYHKEGESNGTKISRGFVFGYMNGLNGLGNGMGGDALIDQKLQDTFIKQNANNSRYRLDSATDGREYHLLTQMVPYIDVRSIIKLTLT